MKKLMVAIAAVASAFGLYAADFAPHKVAFTNLSDGTYNITGDSHWGYSGTAEDLQIKSEKLEIKTGSNALSRYFIDNENASAIPADGLFFDTTIDFKDQALDEVPTIDAGAKLGLFILDASQVDGILPNYATTNLYLVGGYGNGGKALYQLTTIINPEFYASSHRVTIKAYNSALSTGARAGFMLYLDGQSTPVDARNVYVADEDGKFNLNNPVDVMIGSYLGDVTVAPALSGWAKNYQLFLSINADNNQTLASVDFTGNAILDYVDMTNTAYDFIPADASAMSVSVGDGVTLNPEDVVGAIYDGEDTITVPTGVEQFTIKPTFTKEIQTVTVGGEEVDPEGGVYTITFVKDATITISQADAAAYVDEEPYADFDSALAAAIGKGEGAVLKLASAVNADNVGDGYVGISAEITLDLAGQTISGSGKGDVPAVIYNTGKLTIIDTDTSKSGKIAASDDAAAVKNGEGGSLYIQAGIYDGAVQKYDDAEVKTIFATAGDFLKLANGEEIVKEFPAEGYQVVSKDDNYWTIKELPKTFTVTATPATGGEYTTQYKIGDDEFADYTEPVEADIDATVTIKYTAATGYTITAGDVVAVTNESQSKDVPAPTFAAKAYKLNATAAANTTLTKSPDAATYAYNADVELTAALAEGDFEWDQIPTGWQPGENNTLTLTYTIRDENEESGNVVETPTAKAKAAPVPTPISGGNTEQKNAYAEWVKGITGAEGKTDAIYADAFALKVTQKEIDDADGSIQKATEKKLGAEITSDMVAALAAGTEVDFAALEAKYPNAEFEFVEAKELDPEEGVSGFWRLQAKFKALPEPEPVKD